MWILFVILIGAERYYVNPHDVYPTEMQCLEQLALFMMSGPKPKMNYEAICIQTDHNIGGV